MKKQNQGISLISLIITIIVIIIIGAVVIFSGMGTPEKAQLSAIISDMDNVQTAVDQAYYGFYTEKSVAGEVWTKSQFYEAVATGETSRENLKGVGIVPISDSSMVKMTLPKYEGRSWGVAVEDIDDHTQVGSVVLLPGYETDGKIYATLLDVQNDGRDTESMDNVMTKLNEESEKSSVELSYQYGYVTAKVNNEQVKNAFMVSLQKNIPPETFKEFGENPTFEVICDKMGESPEELLNQIKSQLCSSMESSMTNAYDIRSCIYEDGFVIYGIPENNGEVKVETVNGFESIYIQERDEYIIKGAGDIGFYLSKLTDDYYYGEVEDDYVVVLKINGIQRYQGTYANIGSHFFLHFIQSTEGLSLGDCVEVEISATINGKTISFKGMGEINIPG